MADAEDKPVLAGLVALVAVAVVVGLVAGLAALLGTRVLGLGGDSGTDGAEAEVRESLYLPEPVKTEPEDGPLVTLIPTDDDDPAATEAPTKKKKKEKKPERRITLSQGSFQVASGEQLYLTGIYPEGEGTVLDIQYRLGNGAWEEFPLDVSVSDETFATYVETYRSGRIAWRMRDASRNLTSNVVTVRHG